jgi:NTE family protein
MADHEHPEPVPRAGAGPAIPLPNDIALVLQGGGALGSFQAGVFEELAARQVIPSWIAGISIGAINAALIAGNPPERRIAALNAFWEKLSSGMPNLMLPDGEGVRDHIREAAHLGAAWAVASFGVPGFFRPHAVAPSFAVPGSEAATSWYDSRPLARTLDELVDWRLLNEGPIRLSVGAVDIESGNFVYFDTRGDRPTRIDARHIMASGALPPGLPAVRIGARHYWDGGLVSNTPLAHILDRGSMDDRLIFQVDLFPQRGQLPRELSDVWSREKDIRYSSRTRAVTDQYVRQRREHALVRRVLAKLPPELADDPDVAALRDRTADHAVSIVHLIYRARNWESGARDFEFSRQTMVEHWQQGRASLRRSLRRGDVIARNLIDGRTAAFDLDDGKDDTP